VKRLICVVTERVMAKATQRYHVFIGPNVPLVLGR
jgi:hypothetical protein